MSSYRGAVLIVGSLWWDTENEIRANWQRNRLNIDDKQFVNAPVRYGRKSSSWGDTYTMVFSQLCYRKDYGLGTALLVPFKKRIETAEDLIQEAGELWRAESKRANNDSQNISTSWGAIGLLQRPDLNMPDEIVGEWKNHFRKQCSLPKFNHSITEKPAINKDGLLNMRWVKRAGDNLPVDLDLLLATANQPTLNSEKYPSARNIANAWRNDEDDNVRYFRNNQATGITTFQDEQIKKFLDEKGS